MDLQAAVAVSLEKLIASGKIEEHIESVLAKTIGSTIAEAFGQYSDFAKSLKEKVGKAIALHADLDLPTYGHAVLQVVRNQVQAAMDKSIEREIAGAMAELLKPAPATIHVSELVSQYKEYVCEHLAGGCRCDGDPNRIGLIARTKESGGLELFLDESGKDYHGAEKNEQSYDVWIGCSKEGSVYWLAFRGQDIDKRIFAGTIYGFQRSLFAMKVAGTKLIDDRDEVELDPYLPFRD